MSAGEASDEISHGLCRPCAIHFMADVGVSLEEFIESIDAPVVTVADGITVGTANAKARKLIGKPMPAVTGSKPGDVFECEYALHPEGCGLTVHCSGCAIRQSVGHTLKTGEPLKNIAAFLNHNEPEGSRKIDLLISTHKEGGVVFLEVNFVD